jgi:uncharacterized protein (DUF927 family)
MSDASSISSYIGAFIGRQIDDLNKAKAATSASFANVLHNVETAVGLRPKTGFTSSGATYEANTIAGKTRAAFGDALNATKSALHIKP